MNLLRTLSQRPTTPPRRPVSARVFAAILWCLGAAMEVASRVLPSLRAQITRPLVFEISSEDGVARRWRFDPQRRRVVTGPAEGSPDHALRFADSRQALRALLSPAAVDRIVTGYLRGTVRFEGSAVVLIWFFGLTRRLFRIGREPGPRRPLPGAYVRHDPGACGAETIPIEPAAGELDPAWAAAWETRAKLWLLRAATGEPMPEG